MSEAGTTYWRAWDNPKNGKRYAGWHTRQLRPVPCGTVTGYYRHLRRREVPDQACCAAVAVKRQAERERQVALASEALGRPVSVREAVRFLRHTRADNGYSVKLESE